MGLAERKEVNLDFSKEDDEKRPAAQVLHWRRIYIYINIYSIATFWEMLNKLYLKTRPHNHQKLPGVLTMVTIV